MIANKSVSCSSKLKVAKAKKEVRSEGNVMEISDELKIAPLEMTDEVTIGFRTIVSLQHIQAAAIFTRKAAEVEVLCADKDSTFREKLITEHKSYVMAAIFYAVAFLETIINEAFADASEPVGILYGLDSNSLRLLADMWDKNVPRTARYSIIEKFDIALTLLRKSGLNRGKSPVQEVSLLIKLRNELIHSEPESIVVGAEHTKNKDTKLIKGLKGQNFFLSPLLSGGNPFYPDRCLSYGCAKWAVESSINFVDQFFSKIGIKPPYEYIRKDLSNV